MKRKKWSEVEEQSLLSKYSDLLNSGTLPKLKTREKKFRPIADHVNSEHHLQDPITFPFKWSWRDVSIKVQNMRHQYLGVKQKIRISNSDFNWDDGEIHWVNFLKYKQVFGDIELSDTAGKSIGAKFGDEVISGILGYDVGSEEIEDDEEVCEEEEEEDGEEEGEEEEGGDLGASDGGERGAKEGNEELGFNEGKKWRKGKRLRIVGAKVLELRDVIMRREERCREREWSKETEAMENEAGSNEREMRMKKQIEDREEGVLAKEMELEELQVNWRKRELERSTRLERELELERRRRKKREEKWEEEEMEWRERLVGMQTEHEKQMMQMHADSCQNQLQILGVVARILCQFFGGAGHDGLGALTPQVVLQQHPGGGLSDNGGKADAASPSEFL
ncbi:hypothetical protein ABFX02_08G065900 [Erythranthe guttata]